MSDEEVRHNELMNQLRMINNFLFKINATLESLNGKVK